MCWDWVVGLNNANLHIKQVYFQFTLLFVVLLVSTQVNIVDVRRKAAISELLLYADSVM